MTQTLQFQPKVRDFSASPSQLGPADILARRLGSSANSVLHNARLASLSADFAQTLSVSANKLTAGKADGKNDLRPDRSRADEDKADDVSSDETAEAEDTDEASESSEAENAEEATEADSTVENQCCELPGIDQAATQQATDSAQIDLQTTEAQALSPDVDPTAALAPEQLVNEQPVTINILNALLLQGNGSPRLALVAPHLRPGAELTRDASAAAQPLPDHARQAAKAPAPLAPAIASQSSVVVEPKAAPAHTGSAETIAAASGLKQPTRSAPAHTAQSQSSSKDQVAQVPGAPAPIPAAAAIPFAGRVIAPSREQSPSTTRASFAVDAASHKLLNRLTSDRSTARAAEPAIADKSPQFQRALDAQLQRGVAQALQSSTGTLTLRLQPANLGQLKVQVKLDGQTIRARFETSTVKTREILTRSIENLRTSLDEKGLKLEDVAVALSPRLPDRDLGLPPVHTQAANDPAASGAAFANHQPSAGDADTGGAHSHHPFNGDSQPAEPGAAEMSFFDEQPVVLIGESASALTIGQDGRIRVDTTV